MTVLQKFLPMTMRPLESCLAQISRSIAFRNALTQQADVESSFLQPLVDAAELFTRLGIPYALVGGIAAMVYGRARFTDDIDFVVASNHESILAAHQDVVRACHFDSAGAGEPSHASGITLDIWKHPHADQIAARARDIQLAGRTLRIADVHDLIAMKLRAGRFQDDYDISEIVRQTPVDDQTLQTLIPPDEFKRFIAIRHRLESQRPA